MEEELASSRSATHGGTTLKECQRMIHKSLQSPTVKSLREHMDKAGCPVRDNFFMAVNCNQGTAGGYIQGEGIVVCSDQIGSQDEVNQVIMHELIHAFDDCRAANLDWLNCAHHACSEIRANHLSGDCHYKRELLRGFWKVKGHEQECIKRRAMTSVSYNPSCSGAAAAKEAVEAVWDVCYNDTEPFERAP
ncbi:mitochondrial inner membrane protease ATP23-like isoform X3 [Lotus japonicus]|uniref:mitochondrial inner membrane protease ATP23-like isoform X3 n=1 Tax=Lotus japonicus TaxID=34305 RepID=UPI00258A6F7D|nr:mitochondrial inner membrane protease ATP23-like isoform X3 [Lotus japonicus]